MRNSNLVAVSKISATKYWSYSLSITCVIVQKVKASVAILTDLNLLPYQTVE